MSILRKSLSNATIVPSLLTKNVLLKSTSEGTQVKSLSSATSVITVPARRVILSNTS
ncbi:UNVERIFIED_CONTAM: hypothetical protein GTU68_036666 [Idotea baltica]|nr:hypothetical protein [Idotea baltica]